MPSLTKLFQSSTLAALQLGNANGRAKPMMTCDGCGKEADMFSDEVSNEWQSATIEGIEVTCCGICSDEIWSVAMEIKDRAERGA